MNYLEILISQLSNREKSVLIWTGIFLIYAFTTKGFLKNLIDLIKQFLKISWVFGLEIAYFVGVIALLNWIGFWEIGMLKDSIVIAFTTIFLVLKYKSEQIAKNKKHFIKILFENLTLVTVIEFITGIYTLSLIFELLFVPIVFIIACFSAVANIYHKDKPISKIFDKMLILIGLVMLIWSILGAFQNSSEFLTLLNIKLFLYPFISVLLFLPFYYLLVLFTTYEWYFASWKHVIGTNMKKPEIYKVLRNKVLIKANFKLYKFYEIYEKIRLNVFELDKGDDIEKLFSKINNTI